MGGGRGERGDACRKKKTVWHGGEHGFDVSCGLSVRAIVRATVFLGEVGGSNRCAMPAMEGVPCRQRIWGVIRDGLLGGCDLATTYGGIVADFVGLCWGVNSCCTLLLLSQSTRLPNA